MLKSQLTPEQEKIFFQVYNNILHAEMSNTTTSNPTIAEVRGAMYDATNIALNTLDILYNEDGTMKPLPDIITFFENTRPDELMNLPKCDH